MLLVVLIVNKMPIGAESFYGLSLNNCAGRIYKIAVSL